MAAIAFDGFYTSSGGRPAFGDAVIEEWGGKPSRQDRGAFLGDRYLVPGSSVWLSRRGHPQRNPVAIVKNYPFVPRNYPNR